MIENLYQGQNYEKDKTNTSKKRFDLKLEQTGFKDL